MQRRRRTLREIFIGDRAFYAMVMMIVLPMIVQNAVTNFVNLLDNLMVGRIGTDPMTGVSIVNQLMFVFNLCIFGGLSGAGIFAAQYHGAKDEKGVRYCFRFKLYLCLLVIGIGLATLIAGGRGLIGLYLNEDDPERVAATMDYALRYLRMMLWGLAPFAISQAYASTLREVGETRVPMVASVTAVFMNLVLNYVLIYGKLGLPALGVEGAALATVISRYAELLIVAVYTHRHSERYGFIVGAYASPAIPTGLVKEIIVKGMPLLVNEALWSSGMAVLLQCYSVRGLDVVSALNITSTVANLMNVMYLSVGGAAGIVVGQALGAGRIDDAKRYVWWMVSLSMLMAGIACVILIILAPLVPQLYNTEPAVRSLATRLLYVVCVDMPILSFANVIYFVLRSGGKTVVTFLFDSVYTWAISVPLAFVLAHYTAVPVVTVYLLVYLADLFKCVLGYILIKKGIWIHRIVV